jgi:hypothetical protein
MQATMKCQLVRSKKKQVIFFLLIKILLLNLELRHSTRLFATACRPLLLHLMTTKCPKGNPTFSCLFFAEPEDIAENTGSIGQGADGTMSPKHISSVATGLTVDVDSLRIAGNIHLLSWRYNSSHNSP